MSSKSVADLTVEEVERELRALAEEQPDFVYCLAASSCCYNQGSPEGPDCSGCMFGQAFQRLGVARNHEDLECKDDIESLGYFHHDVRPPDSWLTVQSRQDSGFTWRDAVAALDEEGTP